MRMSSLATAAAAVGFALVLAPTATAAGDMFGTLECVYPHGSVEGHTGVGEHGIESVWYEISSEGGPADWADTTSGTFTWDGTMVCTVQNAASNAPPAPPFDSVLTPPVTVDVHADGTYVNQLCTGTMNAVMTLSSIPIDVTMRWGGTWPPGANGSSVPDLVVDQGQVRGAPVTGGNGKILVVNLPPYASEGPEPTASCGVGRFTGWFPTGALTTTISGNGGPGG